MKDKNQKGSAIVWVLVVIVVILGGYIFLSKKSNIPSSYQSPSPTPINETANWKTYTSSSQNIIFSYPSSWRVKDDTYARNGSTYYLFHINSPDRFDLPGYAGVGVHYLIQISVDPTTNKIEWIADFAETKPLIVHQSAWNTNLSKTLTKQTEEYKLGQKIISSFKVTGQSATTSDQTSTWNTCLDNSSGLQFRYPAGWYIWNSQHTGGDPVLVSSCNGDITNLSYSVSDSYDPDLIMTSSPDSTSLRPGFPFFGVMRTRV